ncbi:MAG: DegQ family serine endoprotease [Alphaproteobacteria bacterium]|nr:DegQ family serine endoprotease [Alphaproteobacteria bacterium]
MGAAVKWTILALLALLALVSVAPVPAEERRLPLSRAESQLSFAPLVKQAAPAVVNIYVRQVVQEAGRSPFFDDPFFRQFFGDRFNFDGPARRRMQASLGSGVLVSQDGLIVTNHHVVRHKGTITVALADRREFEAKLVLSDEKTDLAILRIDAAGEHLPHLPLGDSDALEVGDLVLAIGNPFNVGQTVTSGIVSALARSGVGASDLQSFIQTDAAINPGNSGGALIDMAGRLVGVNTAIFSRSGGSHGIGFAVPASVVRVVLQSAKTGSPVVRRPWLGAALQDVTAERAGSLGLARPGGALVRQVAPGSPAEAAGLRPGDVIVELEGKPVADAAGTIHRLGTLAVGGRAGLTAQRDGRAQQLSLPLLRAPETPPRNETALNGRHPLAGATIANLSPALAEEMDLDTTAGVVVIAVRGGSPAANLRVRAGDRVLAVNGVETGSVEQVRRQLDRATGEWRLNLQRGEQVLNLIVRA